MSTEFKSPGGSMELPSAKMLIMPNILSTMSLKNQDERISGLMNLMSEEDMKFIMKDLSEQALPSKCKVPSALYKFS
jgi:hypothetical protein